MPTPQTFTLSEATALLPKLKKMLNSANKELTHRAELLAETYAAYEKCERQMNTIKPISAPVTGTVAGNSMDSGFADLRRCRLDFQNAIESLSAAKQNYIHALNFWFDEITDTGVVLRDIKSGLLDFPAHQGNFYYYLCWRLGENEITHWHVLNEGFTGRRPLAVLSEYL